MKRFILLVLVVLAGTACIPRKKLTYLQRSEDDVNKVYELNRSKYKVQSNDILSITIRAINPETAALFNTTSANANLNAGDLIFYLNGFTVDFEGNIEMPIVGKVNVRGLNTEEIKSIVESKLGSYFKEEAVYITVQLAGVRYSVVGDVSKPGKYVIYQNQVNIFEALAQAGDITIVGNRNEVQLIRQNPSGVTIMELDLTDANVIEKSEYFIQPNVIINVKPLPQKSLGIGTTGFQTFTSIFGVIASTVTLIIALNRL